MISEATEPGARTRTVVPRAPSEEERMRKRPNRSQWYGRASSLAVLCALVGALSALSSCEAPLSPPSDLVSKGREIFFNETFKGNGRTCGTCHPAQNNLALDPAFIATLPP